MTDIITRPHTPVGWSDTDWLAHLSTMPPIGYAVRDTLYGTSKAGVLRFCPSTESGAFAVYTAPPQRKPMTEDEIELAYRHIYRNLPYEFDHSTPSWVEQGIRYAERAHGIGDSDA